MSGLAHTAPHSDLSLVAGGLVTATVTGVLVWILAATFYATPLGLPGGSDEGPRPPPSPAPAHLYLTIQINPSNDWPQYVPANFTVLHGTLVVVTLENYDNGLSPVSASEALVQGTVGGTETLNGTQTVTAVDPNSVSHTFTILRGLSTPLNVPIPVASGAGGTPTEVTFTTIFDHAETITWTCMAPCGSGPMSTPGFMAGTITVS